MSDLVDAHTHLWNRATDWQPWIDPVTMAAIDRDFTVDDLGEMLDATGVRTAVVVQTRNSRAATKRLLTQPGPRIAGVVGWADCTADVAAQLDELCPAQRRRLVGIRHLVHVDPDPGWLGRPDVGRALGQLAARALPFDLVVRSWQLPLAATVASRHPGASFVLDHLGGIAETTDDAGWERGLRDLAARPNVRAKISGLAGLADDAIRLRRVIGVALDAFGPDRLMFSSGWPLVCLGAGPIAWRRVVGDLIGELSPAERHAVMSGTASNCYRLGA